MSLAHARWIAVRLRRFVVSSQVLTLRSPLSSLLAIASLTLLMPVASATQFDDVNRGLTQRDVQVIAIDAFGVGWVGVPGAVWRTGADGWNWRARVLLRGSDGEVLEEETLDAEDPVEAWQEAFDLRVEELLEEKIEELRDELYNSLTEEDAGFWDPQFIEELIDEALDELREEAEMEAEAELGAPVELELADVDESFDGADEPRMRERAVARHIVFDPDEPGRVWIGSSTGLLRVDDEGFRVSRIPVGSSEGSEDVRGLAWDEGRLWVASRQGLFEVQPVSGHATAAESYGAGDALRFVARCEDALWVVEESRLMRSPDEGDGVGAEWFPETPVGMGEGGPRHVLCLDDHPAWQLVLSTSGGVHVRTHEGTWQRLSQRGLPSLSVRMSLLDSKGALWVATAGGAARWTGEGWSRAPGLEFGTSVTWLAESAWQTLVAATDGGLIELVEDEAAEVRDETLRTLQARWRREPGTHQLIEAAWQQAGLGTWNPTSWSRQRLASHFVPSRAFIEVRRRTFESRRNDRRDSFPTGDIRLTWLDVDNTWTEATARVVWDFGNPARVSRQLEASTWERTLVRHQRALATRVLRLQRQRREAMIVLETTRAGTTQRRIRASMTVLRLTAELDAMTGYHYDLTALLSDDSR